MSTKTKAIDRRIEAAYRRTCSGVQIDMLDIPRVFGVGRAAIAEGVTDEALDLAITTFVATIRRN